MAELSGRQASCLYVASNTLPLYLNFKAIGQLVVGDIAFQRFGGYKCVINECSLGVNLVIDNFLCRLRYFTSV